MEPFLHLLAFFANDFEKTAKGFIDFLLLDSRGFPSVVLRTREHERREARFLLSVKPKELHNLNFPKQAVLLPGAPCVRFGIVPSPSQDCPNISS
jgi:hypothetical protein